MSEVQKQRTINVAIDKVQKQRTSKLTMDEVEKQSATKLELNSPLWIKPPVSAEPTFVDFRIDVNDISQVDTVLETASIEITLNMYWTDNRLNGWDPSEDLPQNLWTPRFEVTNAIEQSNTFRIPTVSDACRVKLAQVIRATMKNPMNLKEFPFDINNIAVKLKTGTHFRALDGSVEGIASKGKHYSVRPVETVSEGTWIVRHFSGRINEWELHGMSTNIFEVETVTGQEQSCVHLGFHISRTVTYYFWKALLPLYLVTILSFTTFEFQVEDLESRSSTIGTYFLAASALLYVVGDALPRTSFLTKIDQVIIFSITCIVTIGISSILLYHMVATEDSHRLERWNRTIEIVLASMYVLANFNIFLPCMVRRRRGIELLNRKGFTTGCAKPDTQQVGDKFPALIDRPSVPYGADYFRWHNCLVSEEHDEELYVDY